MKPSTIVLSIPALREADLEKMPRLSSLVSDGSRARIEHGFPAVTWPSQTNVLTGQTPDQHGVVANGFFWRDSNKVEMWTAWNEVILQPQIWDVLKRENPSIQTAAWFPMLAKGCNADFVCMPAPIHQPDGSEEMWCHTKPQPFYGELLEQLGHFPLHHFWGPIANIKSSQWILDSAMLTAEKYRPDFWYIYLPHLDYAAQKDGPNSATAMTALEELDQAIGEFADRYTNQINVANWLIVSEYTITEVNHVAFPNRILRENDFLKVTLQDDGEHLDFENSAAWALVDHQFSHVFVKDHDRQVINQLIDLFESKKGYQMILHDEQLEYVNLKHERAGDLVLVSEPESWQAYYWWNDDNNAPGFARTVDIHRKPGYDPVELHFDPATKSIPLDATLVKGSHGVPAVTEQHCGVIACSLADQIPKETLRDIEIFDIMLQMALS